MTETQDLRHIGIIADGNRRWARKHGLPVTEGHRHGFELVEPITEFFQDEGVKFISFFLFSTENWDRSPEEVNFLMSLVRQKVNKIAKLARDKNLRVYVMGRPDPVDPTLWQKLIQLEDDTKDNTSATICLHFNYGGHWEIADAATKAIAAGETDLTPETFRNYLYHPDVPDLDLVVRTSGEERLSGFSLWRSAYAELLFYDKYFPELTEDDLQKFIDIYQQRSRRFGK